MMAKLLEQRLIRESNPLLTFIELETLINKSANARYSKVKRLLAEGKLLQIRRGLYYIPEKNTSSLHPFPIAQFIYAPSYISLESALSYHKLIPETVYTVTSASTKRSKTFETPLGTFSYLRLPLENFYTEVDLITENNHSFLMAKPWKAICDYIYCYKKNWKSMDPLLKSLRIADEDLPELRDEEIELLTEYYHHSRISRFLKAVQRGRK